MNFVAWRAVLAVVLSLYLSGCDSPEERAEKHFANGLALLDEGKLEQALIEFRNTLQDNNAHTAARFELAQVLERTENPRAAIGQYMALLQQDDANGPVHLALARLAVEQGDFEAAEAHAQKAFELLPDDPMARALKASVEFRGGDKQAAVTMAREVLADAPANIPAHLVVVADRMAAADFAGALDSVDAALAHAPESGDLHLARLAALEGQQDPEAVGRQLQEMVQRFPENEGYRRALLRWYVDQGDTEGAVDFMREVAKRTPDDPAGYLNVAQLILELSGPEAARQELQDLIETSDAPEPYIRALAQLDFQLGNRDAAIASLRTLTEGEETSPEKRDLQITLARMLLQTGAGEEANALVDSVLAVDDRHVEALKLRARRLIDEDRTEEALRDLSAANLETSGNPDPEILTLMAQAHQREGAHELAGQRLAQALQASGGGREEAVRYVRFLLADDRFADAEGILLDALRRAPNDLDLLALLGQSYLFRQDWTRARQTAERIRRLETPAAENVARSLDLTILRGEGRTEDAIDLLRGPAAQAGDDIRPRLAVVEALIAAGDLAEAEAEVRTVLDEFPDAQAGRLLLANILSRGEDTAEAEQIYRDLIAELPEVRLPYEGLASLLHRQGRVDEARAVLDAGIAATDRAGSLLNMMAESYILRGEFDEAIRVYTELYERDPSNVVIANNLASLLSTHRDDAESLEQAFRAARRLRGTDNPYHQDTYGWILTRRGDAEQALTYLEPAAEALGNDPLTQYHLGVTYLDLQRWDDARAALSRAIEIAGEDSSSPQIQDARRRLAEIDDLEAGAPDAAPAEEAGQ